MSRPTSTVSGLVSGIDWDTTIKQLMAIERRRAAIFETRKDENQTKLSLWAQIQAKVASLQGTLEGINQRSEFAVKSASSSDSDVVAVTASAAAAEGAHTVEVLQLATAHRVAAQGWADKNAIGVGDSGGDLVIQVGDETITIADADLSAATTLEQLRNLINSSPENDDFVTASILDDGSGSNRYRLVITSNDTGANHEISITSNPTNLDFATTQIDVAETETGWTGTSSITTAGTYSGSLNKTFTFTVAGSGSQTIGAGEITVDWVDSLGNTGSFVIPNGYGGENISVTEGVELSFGAGDLTGGESFNVDVFNPLLAAAQSARVRMDGIYMSKASNKINDVWAGVTLDLLSAVPGTTVNITVSNDTQGVKSKIQSFINGYNAAMGDLRTFSSYDEENETAAPLLGDGFLSDVRSRLAGSVLNKLAGLPAGALYDSLAVIGIRSSTGGLLTISHSQLDMALDDHFDDVVDLFTQNFSAADSKIFFVSANQSTQSGEYSLVVNYGASGDMTSATINGQSAVVEGKLIRGAEGTSVEGLVLGFTSPGSGPGSINTTMRFSQGAAGELWAETTLLQDSESGPIHLATEGINDSIEALDRQITA
ncbi:flagellar filament capping protein FliD, partial [bacterium]|nr:flagellar filament capping protein FliD [bacterium]